jgi:hypothetical protein
VCSFCCIADDGWVDDHSAEAGSVVGVDAEVWEVGAEERRERVADFPAKGRRYGFGGFEGHPVAFKERLGGTRIDGLHALTLCSQCSARDAMADIA